VDVERWSDLGDYEIVRREGGAGAVGVVALTPAEEVLLVRQFRHPVRAMVLEIPAGLRDVPDESPEDCAKREMFEETGYHASGPARHLGDFYSSAGMTDERFSLYAARTGAGPSGHPEEGIEVILMPIAQALAACADGRIQDSKTALGLLLAAG
jgi:8-oxo-dGTP pyrophosphatase MutT (NUDIX family)